MRRLLYRNFRTAERIGAWFERQFTPMGSVLVIAVLSAAVFGIDTRRTLAFQAFALFLALFLVAAVVRRWRAPRLGVMRRLPATATVGVPCSYVIEVRNDGTRLESDLFVQDRLDDTVPSFAEFTALREPPDGQRNWFDRRVGYPRWADAVRRRRGGSTGVHAVPRLPPRETVSVRAEVVPLRRGYLRFTSIRVLRPDPLGLLYGHWQHAQAESLLVLPQRYPVLIPRAAGRRRLQPGGEALAISVGDSQEFAGLRDYRPGDPLRHVHWRSWARTGRPVVKEFVDEFFDRNALVLDTFGAGVAPRTFEAAVSVAASFACADWGPDSLLDLLFVAPHAVRATSGRGLGGASLLLELLACVEPSPQGEFATLSDLVLGHAPQLGMVVCVLLGWDETRQSLISRLRAGGVRVRVLVVGAERAGALDPGPLRDEPGAFLVVDASAPAASLAMIGASSQARAA